jgi:hypothetical protein
VQRDHVNLTVASAWPGGRRRRRIRLRRRARRLSLAQAATAHRCFRRRPAQGRGAARAQGEARGAKYGGAGLACPARTPRCGGAGLHWSPGGGRCVPPAGPRWACAAGLRPGLERARAGRGRNRSWAESGVGLQPAKARANLGWRIKGGLRLLGR